MVVVVVVMYVSYRNTPRCVGVQWSTLFLYTCSINSDSCSPGWSAVVVAGGSGVTEQTVVMLGS